MTVVSAEVVDEYGFLKYYESPLIAQVMCRSDEISRNVVVIGNLSPIVTVIK